MASQIWDEHDESSNTIVMAANGLRKKLNIILPHLKSKWNYLACTNWIPGSIPITADALVPNEVGRSIPTEVEVCLLFCSMFPAGFILPIEDFVMYGMALNLFEDMPNMSQVRCRVSGLINIINHRLPPHYLNKLCLWEDKYGDRYVKVLDGALDLARSIALKYQLAFGPEIDQSMWPSTDLEKYCYRFSIALRRINQQPVNLEFPKLASVQLHREDSERIPAELFQGTKELVVLSLDVPSLSRSLSVLSNLRMLRLKLVEFENMTSIGSLINLEFLSISTPILTDIPKEMGQLGNLRLLDLRNMNIAWFPPGVLSRMLKLEELYLPLSFRRWGCKAQDEHDDYDEWDSMEEDDYGEKGRNSASTTEINDGERMNASISEIVSHFLNALQITIPKASILPKKSPIFKNMQRFKILVPNSLKFRPLGKRHSLNVLQLTGDAYDIQESGICDLLSRTEDLNLTRVRNLKDVMFEQQDYDFPHLQKMLICECDELEYVIDIAEKQIVPQDDYLFSKLEILHLSMLSNLKEIWRGTRTKIQWFSNLSQISIRFCHKLKYVFPVSIVKECTLLRSIRILDCHEMLGIFYQDEEDDNPLVPYFIEELDLHSLPKLVDFLVLKDDTVYGDNNGSVTTEKIASNSLEGSIYTYGDNFQSFSTNESTSRLSESCASDEEPLCTASTSTSEGKLQQCATQLLVFNEQVSFIKNSGVISHIETCHAFSSKFAEKWLQNLKRLKIAFCDAVKVIFLFEENHGTSTAFNSLKVLELYALRNLEHIWFLVPLEIIAFQNLKVLVLSECQNLYLFSPQVAKLFVSLQKVYIIQCERIEEVMVNENDNEVEGTIVFPRLKLLELQHLPNLRTFFNWIHPIELPLLESLKFNQCNKMKSFSHGPSWTPRLDSVEINANSYSVLRDGLNAIIERYTGNCFGTPSCDPSSIISSNNPTPESSCEGHSSDDNSSSIISPNSLPPPRSSNTPLEPSAVVLSGTSCSSASEANEEANSNDQILSFDDNFSSKSSIYSYNKQDGYIKLHNTSGELDDSNGVHGTPRDDSNESHSTHGELDDFDDELDWLYEIDLLDGTTVEISTSEANEEGNQNYMKEFTFVDLKIATSNFSLDAWLGGGGFGNVYKGWLDEKTYTPSKTCTGMAVAINKMKPNSRQGVREWQSEVYFLERLWHPNVVTLLGYCWEDEELLLVYEFMHKGSLDNHLFKRNPTIEPLSWNKRLKIAIGAARGLAFLHTSGKIVHRDVKASNIMLDDNYNAKISDFGLAGLGPSNEDLITSDIVKISDFGLTRMDPLDNKSPSSTKVAGTLGYIDPEYLMTGCLHAKSDVYSFGVVLLQLMTGSRAADANRPGGQPLLVHWSKLMLSEKKGFENIIDPSMEGQYSSRAMLLMMKLAFKCTEKVHQRRPSMAQVFEALQKIYTISEGEKAHSDTGC